LAILVYLEGFLRGGDSAVGLSVDSTHPTSVLVTTPEGQVWMESTNEVPVLVKGAGGWNAGLIIRQKGWTGPDPRIIEITTQEHNSTGGTISMPTLDNPRDFRRRGDVRQYNVTGKAISIGKEFDPTIYPDAIPGSRVFTDMAQYGEIMEIFSRGWEKNSDHSKLDLFLDIPQ